MTDDLPRLYTELADWWPLLSAPEDYAEEASVYAALLAEHCDGPIRRVLELGSGGGNNASHFPVHWELTLVDPSPAMQSVSKSLNPRARHLPGDMRSFRIDETFDAVFIHDAICYMATREDLAAAMRTAFVHLRPGGAALFCPDDTEENFREQVENGGHDGDDRALRYLSWQYDEIPGDGRATTLMTYLLRQQGRSPRSITEVHEFGLFPRQDWLRLMAETGFTGARGLPFEHSELEEGQRHEIFVGVRPG